ncbi:hypothetical protein TNCV_933761 [Trichonephila clavipes]|nr:hypothetical protein TNCV_933761 [Trichonephila clavipes]
MAVVSISHEVLIKQFQIYARCQGPNTIFRYLLSTSGPFKLVTDQKRPELANRRGVGFHQDNARPHVCSDSPETLGA